MSLGDQLPLFESTSAPAAAETAIDAPPSDAPGVEPTFYFGPFERSGMERYVHLIQGPDDPKRSPRAPGRSLLWRTLDDHSPEQWCTRIVEHLEDGIPRTFNRIMVELADFESSVAFESNADFGLWLAVERQLLVLTAQSPILFVAA